MSEYFAETGIAEEEMATPRPGQHHIFLCHRLLDEGGRKKDRWRVWKTLQAVGPSDLDLLHVWSQGSIKNDSALRKISEQAGVLLHHRLQKAGHHCK